MSWHNALTSRTGHAGERNLERRPRGWSGLIAVVTAFALVIGVGVAAVRAGSCRVLVALGSMQVESTDLGSAVVRLSGTWEFDNLLQVSSGLSFNVLVVRDDNFVRLNYPDTSYSGNFPGLAEYLDEGITGDKLTGIESAGSIEPAAKYAVMESQRMKLAVPVPPGTGPISAIAYLVIDGDYKSAIISNVLSATPSADTTAPQVTGGTGVVR